jgi:hypothetical protein
MPDETPTDSTEEQSVEAERPEWLPEKFETPEALAKSYSEMERKLTEQGQEKSNLEMQLEDLYGRLEAVEQQPHQQQPAYNPSTDPLLIAYQNAMENGDYQAALAIQLGLTQQVAQQQIAQAPKPEQPANQDDAWAYIAEQTAIQKVGGAEEWAQYRDRVEAEANNESWEGLSAQQAGNKLARIYRMVKADDVLNNQKTVAEQQAEAERQAKLAAQTMPGSSGRPPQPTRDEAAAEAIKKAARENSYENLFR